MSKKKAILVATIGTRDLAFRVSSQEWLNLGNSYVADSDSISEQALVQMELGLEKCDFRFLTEYLLENWQQYQEQLQPIILGQLFQDNCKQLKAIYLVATDQSENVKFRDKDTLYSAYIIQRWVEKHYQIPTEVILQGAEGGNPADFEAMFRWWKQTWQYISGNKSENSPILLCVKGGVGAFSEAGRVTALSLFGEDTFFYDFIKDDELNRLGKPSRYTVPFQGKNYLWDRKQQEALALLKRYDYEAVDRVLSAYFAQPESDEQNGDLIGRIEKLIKAAILWNHGDFEDFARSLGEMALTRSRQWWWIGYEAAFLGVIRFKQGNTIEAMFHSFRAVEGLMSEWAIDSFPDHITRRDGFTDLAKGKVPLVNKSIARLPGLQNYLNQFKGESEIGLHGTNLDNLVQLAKPGYKQNRDIQKFWDVAKNWRNQLFHRLLGLEKKEVFSAWETYTQKEWESRVLSCLNFLSGQRFLALSESSLMAQVHEELLEAIAAYQP